MIINYFQSGNKKSLLIGVENEKFLLEGKGWGHGVGLCQIGALGMALSKYKVDKILSHYYPKSILKSIY